MNSPITSSSGTYLTSDVSSFAGIKTNLGSRGGTFTLAKCSVGLPAFFRTTARFSERPEM